MEVRKRMSVHGIKSFKPPRHQYPHPYGIIGASVSAKLCDCVTVRLAWSAKAGYNGIKTALYLLKASNRAMCVRYVKQSYLSAL